MNETMNRRFWEKVNKTKNCWHWIAGKDRCGYGIFRFRNKIQMAHRVSWIIRNKEIPLGLCVLHKCDNPSCVNPKHLFLGTKKDNAIDMVQKNRNYSPNNIGGIPKLKNEDIGKIRQLNRKGTTQKEIGKLFNVCPSHISKILSGDCWSHI